MIPTFTGSSRRPRQVNLSGRNTNPFAKFGAPQTSQNAVAHAQQDRLARQQERERLQAAKTIQKTWRGAAVRQQIRQRRRVGWDDVEQKSRLEIQQASPYNSEEEALSQLQSFLRFYQPGQEVDFTRLEHLYGRLSATVAKAPLSSPGGPWQTAWLGLEEACLQFLGREGFQEHRTNLLQVLLFLVAVNATYVGQQSIRYYSVLAKVIQEGATPPTDVLVAPLRSMHHTLQKYQAFAFQFLTVPNLDAFLEPSHGLRALAQLINCQILESEVTKLLRGSENASRPQDHQSQLLSKVHTTEHRLWLLGHLIYLHRHGHAHLRDELVSADYIFAVSHLLSSLADAVDFELGGNNDDEEDADGNLKRAYIIAPFVQLQIESLINQDSISALLPQMNITTSSSRSERHPNSSDNLSRILATYILTLFRIFPKRGDEIRMWLYLGPSVSRENVASTQGVPVVGYFWQAARSTRVFSDVTRDPRTAVYMLKRQNLTSLGGTPSTLSSLDSNLNDQLRIVFLFIELYLFVLKVMDDEEFFSSGMPARTRQLDSLGRRNALPLDDIKLLVTFLKHLGFSMYYDAPEIAASMEGMSNRGSRGASLTAISSRVDFNSVNAASDSNHVAGLQGMSLDYVKGAVTGLLRAVYERDSRRKFLPPGHWLMTSRFDMTNFIDAVVEEEERRNEVQDEDDDAVDDEPEAEVANLTRSSGLVGTSHVQRLQRLERMQHQQRAEVHRRRLQNVAPRLEILQNMPFLIPFETRVMIFRRFVHMDQLKRRGGMIDPEMWRLSRLHGQDPWRGGLERHEAKIRRGHEFEDAYEAFYDLGPALKEPISITFVNQFDQEEAGIDGGGVTKEFLTSVTNQAFAPAAGSVQLFMENANHLLYPNPSALDEQKHLLRAAGFVDNMPTSRETISALLQRYEFLGRVIGKCLYEGILVDIGFAGFFLLKWALTGGIGVAPRESGYRANLNDLRDFDEELYQGLLQLKNYPGDVEDFSLNFTISDTLSRSDIDPATTVKSITRNLKPNGASLPVTNANRLVYVSYVARHRLQTQPFLQTSAFLRGLSTIIQPAWLSMFNQSELQTLVGGAAAAIDVTDLRRNTQYGGVYVIGDDGLEHPSVAMFWQVMEELPDEDRRKVLKFVTSTPRAPLLGFGSLTPRFSIRDAGADETRLPSTSTCVNLLKLPRYSAKGVCKGKLLQAVNSGAGFDLS